MKIGKTGRIQSAIESLKQIGSESFYAHRRDLVLLVMIAVSLMAMVRYYTFHGRLLTGWDAQFYYATARAFLYGQTADITSALMETPYAKPFDVDADGVFEAVPRGPDEQIQSKYPIGLSIVQVVLLGVGFLLRKVFELGGLSVTGPPGLSSLEIWVVALGLMLIPFLGLRKLSDLLNEWRQVNSWHWPLIVTYFGTTLFYNAAIFPFMSHGLAFTICVYWIAELKKLGEKKAGDPKNGSLAYLGLMAGFLFLIRPQQVLLPLLSIPWLFKALNGAPRSWLPGGALGFFSATLSIGAALLFNKAQFGVWTLNGYSKQGEGFDFLHPQFFYVLFGTERGLFYHTPAVLLALPGMLLLFRQKRNSWSWPALANAAVQIYLVAAWWAPSQGDAFGMRMWTDSVAIVGLGIAAVPLAKPTHRLLYTISLVFCCIWTIYLLLRFRSWI